MAGRPPETSLFKELNQGGTTAPVYSLEKFRAVFLSHMDPTGYKASKELFKDLKEEDRWPTWEKLFKNPVLKDHLSKWTEELYTKLVSDAWTELAIDKNSKDYQRLKFIISGDFRKEGATTQKRGRPKKDESGGLVRPMPLPSHAREIKSLGRKD